MSWLPRKRRTREHIIADLSVNHVELYALMCGYTLERFAHDYRDRSSFVHFWSKRGTGRWQYSVSAGIERADFLQASLDSHTTNMSEVWNEHDSNWCFNCDWERVTINAEFPLARADETALHAVREQIDKILRSDRRFADLIWFDAAKYDAFERPKTY